jgi:hypothetical protein
MAFESLLLIVVVVEAVWILSSLFRGHEEDRKGPAGRPNARSPGTTPNRSRPSSTNVDRFLEEINRRRREAADRQSGGAPRGEAPSTTRPPVPSARPPSPGPRAQPPVLVLSPEQMRRTGSMPRTPRVEAENPQPRTEAIEVIVDERRRSRGPAPVSTSAGGTASQAYGSSEAGDLRIGTAFSQVGFRGKMVSPALVPLLPLLLDRRALRSAFLLKEIFGPPVGQRRRPQR